MKAKLREAVYVPSSSPGELSFCIASCCTGSKMWVHVVWLESAEKSREGLTPWGKDSFTGAEMTKGHFRWANNPFQVFQRNLKRVQWIDFCFVSEKRYHIDQAVLKLATELRLAFNLFSCLSLPTAGIKGTCRHAWCNCNPHSLLGDFREQSLN